MGALLFSIPPQPSVPVKGETARFVGLAPISAKIGDAQ